MAQVSKIYLVSENQFRDLVKNSNSYSDILRGLGLTTKGGSSTDTLKRRISELNIDISHFDSQTYKASQFISIPLEYILVENSSYASISKLKKRLVKDGILEYKCAECGNEGIWNKKPLTLQLDHKNGTNNDHRIENLQFLCPNCHSQTNNYSGKNSAKPEKKPKCTSCNKILSTDKTASGLCRECQNLERRKTDWPTYDILLAEIKELGYVGTGAKHGVSDNAVRNWVAYYKKRAG